MKNHPFNMALSIFLLWALLANIAIAAPPSYNLFDPELGGSGFNVSVYVDEGSKLSFAQIKEKMGSAPVESSRYSIQSTTASYWFAFELTNPSDKIQSRIIRFGEVFMETADLYFEQNGQLNYIENGIKVPIIQRASKSRLPTFEVNLAPKESLTLYLKVKSRFVNYIGIFVSDYQSFAFSNAVSVAGYFAFFGGSLALLAYNFFLYLSLRDSNYLLYVGYGLLFVFFASIYGGFSLFVFTKIQHHYFIHCSIALVFVFMAHFVRNLLDTPSKSRKIDLYLKALAWAFLVIAALIVIDIRYYVVFLHAAIWAAVSFWVIGIAMVKLGSRMAPFYLAATTLYLLGITVSAAMALGLIPYSTLHRHAYMMGSLSELIIFALALGYRYRLIQEDRLNAERRLTEYEQAQRSDLERIVKQRTTELRSANLQLKLMSFTDGLTGISNRRHFDESLKRQWHRVYKSRLVISLVMCDIDFFKAFNDQFGHQAGDDCLHKIAEALANTVKRSNDIVSRYGGEEFAIILPDTNADAARALCEQIQHSVSQLDFSKSAHQADTKITLSFGISCVTPSAQDGAEQLISQADKALYASKQNGRNCITVFKSH